MQNLRINLQYINKKVQVQHCWPHMCTFQIAVLRNTVIKFKRSKRWRKLMECMADQGNKGLQITLVILLSMTVFVI